MRIAEISAAQIITANEILNGKYVIYQETESEFIPLLGAKFHYTEGAESFKITDELGFSCEYGGSINVFITESVMTFHTRDHSLSVIISSFHSLKRIAEVYIEKLKRRIVGNLLTQEVDFSNMKKKLPLEIVKNLVDGIHAIDDFDIAVESFDFTVGDFDISICVNFENDSVLMKNPKADPGAEIVISVKKYKIRCIGKDISSVLNEFYGDLCVVTEGMDASEEEEEEPEEVLEEESETEESENTSEEEIESDEEAEEKESEEEPDTEDSEEEEVSEEEPEEESEEDSEEDEE